MRNSMSWICEVVIFVQEDCISFTLCLRRPNLINLCLKRLDLFSESVQLSPQLRQKGGHCKERKLD